jgi:hypothetical protein
MTDPPKARRRRLWIALSVAIGFGSGLGWWYWPRGDARFVGRWGYYQKGEIEPFGQFTMSRHGVGRFEVVGEPISVSFRWQVVDDKLIFGRGSGSDDNSRLEALADLMLEWTGHTFLTVQETHRFEILGPNEIRIIDARDSFEATLRRSDSK